MWTPSLSGSEEITKLGTSHPLYGQTPEPLQSLKKVGKFDQCEIMIAGKQIDSSRKGLYGSKAYYTLEYLATNSRYSEVVCNKGSDQTMYKIKVVLKN